MEHGIEEAIRLKGLAVLATELGESIQTVSNWRTRKSVPADKCADFERITGVSRLRLRSDALSIWPELATTQEERRG